MTTEWCGFAASAKVAYSTARSDIDPSFTSRPRWRNSYWPLPSLFLAIWLPTQHRAANWHSGNRGVKMKSTMDRRDFVRGIAVGLGTAALPVLRAQAAKRIKIGVSTLAW